MVRKKKALSGQEEDTRMEAEQSKWQVECGGWYSNGMASRRLKKCSSGKLKTSSMGDEVGVLKPIAVLCPNSKAGEMNRATVVSSNQ